MARIALLFLMLALAASPAQAQLGPVGAPSLPTVGDLPGDVVNELPNTANRTLRDVENLANARQREIGQLLRRHRDVLERDPNGQPIVRQRVLAIAPSAEALEAARARGFSVERRDDLDGLGELVVLRAPQGMSTRRALRELREADPDGIYDFDHLHLESGVAGAAATAGVQGAGAGPRIGLIDGGVEQRRQTSVVSQRAFSSEAPVPSAHAEAVAQLIAEAAPGARIVVADIYGGAPTGGAASALSRGLAWLAGEDVPVINVSLVGPHNRIVEAIVARVVARGVIIVAAVGNDGPAARPLYPAAYSGVVGVTGVDERERVLVEAGRGPHVDFAALGVRRDPRVRGTSFAAPTVSGLLAVRMSERADPARALASLRGAARDLGAPGRDDIYGDGLVGEPQRAAAR